MKRLSHILLFFILLLAGSCSNRGFTPDRLLSEQEMVDIMTDVQIIEADINSQKTEERERDPNDSTKIVPKDYVKISSSYYSQLFEHYGITDSIFAQNIKYYTEQPEVLERIMDSVMNRLKKEQSRRDDSQ